MLIKKIFLLNCLLTCTLYSMDPEAYNCQALAGNSTPLNQSNTNSPRQALDITDQDLSASQYSFQDPFQPFRSTGSPLPSQNHRTPRASTYGTASHNTSVVLTSPPTLIPMQVGFCKKLSQYLRSALSKMPSTTSTNSLAEETARRTPPPSYSQLAALSIPILHQPLPGTPERCSFLNNLCACVDCNKACDTVCKKPAAECAQCCYNFYCDGCTCCNSSNN